MKTKKQTTNSKKKMKKIEASHSEAIHLHWLEIMLEIM